MKHSPSPVLASAIAAAVTVTTAAILLASTSAYAVDGATAPYNEAVKIVNGKRMVEVAPLPSHWQSAIPNFHKPDAHGWVHSVETEQGLMDCEFTPFYHPAACAPSDYGKVIRTRDWTVKMKGTWYSCSGRAKPVECKSLVPDGKLHALGGMKE